MYFFLWVLTFGRIHFSEGSWYRIRVTFFFGCESEWSESESEVKSEKWKVKSEQWSVFGPLFFLKVIYVIVGTLT